MADGKRPTITVEERDERGSRETRRLRRSGFVPGVVYGGTGQEEATSFKIGARDLRNALHTGAALYDLKVGSGKTLPVIVKDQQVHPVRGEIMHIDLLEVRLDEKIHATVAIHLEGVEDAPGVKEGGVLEQVTREVSVEALPTDIPESIVVDVSGMQAAGTMHLSEVSAPNGVVLLDDPDETIIATITIPTEVEEPEIEEETEVVGEEAEAGAEGATGEEAEAAAEGESEGGEES
jgi:large subunit ribosomal protein L25